MDFSWAASSTSLPHGVMATEFHPMQCGLHGTVTARFLPGDPLFICLKRTQLSWLKQLWPQPSSSQFWRKVSSGTPFCLSPPDIHSDVFPWDHRTQNRYSYWPSWPGYCKRKFRICAFSSSLGDIIIIFHCLHKRPPLKNMKKKNGAVSLCWRCCGLQPIW